MRYYWGLGVGHAYAHKDSPSPIRNNPPLPPSPGNPEQASLELLNKGQAHGRAHDNLENCMADGDADAWLDLEPGGGDDSGGEDDDYDAERRAEMYFDSDNY